MAKTKTFDPACHVLAHAFLSEIQIHSKQGSLKELNDELASEIQQTIEDFCQGLDKDPDAEDPDFDEPPATRRLRRD